MAREVGLSHNVSQLERVHVALQERKPGATNGHTQRQTACRARRNAAVVTQLFSRNGAHTPIHHSYSRMSTCMHKRHWIPLRIIRDTTRLSASSLCIYIVLAQTPVARALPRGCGNTIRHARRVCCGHTHAGASSWSCLPMPLLCMPLCLKGQNHSVASAGAQRSVKRSPPPSTSSAAPGPPSRGPMAHSRPPPRCRGPRPVAAPRRPSR